MDWRQWLAGKDVQDAAGLEFGFDLPVTALIVWLVLGATLLVGGWFVYTQLRGLKTGLRRGLTLMRLAILSLVLFLAARPVFHGYRFDPDRSYLLMLYDNSRSMSLSANPEQSRGEHMIQRIEAQREGFEDVLNQRYQLAHYGFGDNAERLRERADLTFDRSETNHVDAVESVLRDFQGIDVAGVVLFSDGVDQPGRTPAPDRWPVPVITVGVGDDEPWRDLDLGPVRVDRTLGDDRPVEVETELSAEGLAGRRATVEIRDGDRVLVEKTIDIAADRETHAIRLEFQPESDDWRAYQANARLEPIAAIGDTGMGAAERVVENNTRRFLVDNRRRNYKIFYFSGRPNWEHKYLQRALQEDEEVQLTSAIRISAAETKFVYRGKKSSLVNPLFEGFYQNDADQPRYDEAVFLRFGGKAEEAGKGFPENELELFQYDLLILADVEANFFAQSQLELVREFVRKRGGSLLVLGGPHAFSEGGYEDTVLAGLLPVLLERQRDDAQDHLIQPFEAMPTTDGLLDGAFALDPNPERNRRLWADLPNLVGVNLFPITRPGANVFARVAAANGDLDGAPLFAVQRYGEGRTAILATGATWFWQMHTAPNDGRHPRFWRQLVRGLAQSAADQLIFRDLQDAYVIDQTTDLQLLVRDQAYDEKPGMRSRWRLEGPDGVAKYLPVDESIRETGLYAGAFTPKDEGLYRLGVEVEHPEGARIGDTRQALLVERDRREYEDPRYRPDYLRDLAAKGDGRFFELDQLDRIPDRIPFTANQKADVVQFPIWRFPGFYILLIALFVAEWYLRRTRGRA